jgi:dihydroorotase
VTLEKITWRIPLTFGKNNNTITPIKAGEELSWKMQ